MWPLRSPLLLACLLLGAVTSTAGAEHVDWPSDDDAVAHPALTIRTYASQRDDLPAADSLTLVASLLGRAGVVTRWTMCGMPRPDASCSRTLEAGEVSIRFVNDQGPVEPHRRLPMGDALIDTNRRTGVLATLYLDRIALLAATAGTDRGTVLARAMAHEVAHLLLGTTEHGAVGLMRAWWSQDMLRREPDSQWAFTEDEGRRMRQALARMRAGP
jgi:hypothetical protein